MIKNRPHIDTISTVGRFFIVLVIIISLLFQVFVLSVSAADYPRPTNRSLQLGTTIPGATTTYTFSWRYPSPTTIGSIRLEMCDTADTDIACTNPGADLSVSTLLSQSGGVTGFSILSQNNNEIILSRPSAAANTTQSTYVINDAINPAGLSDSFFVRISTYASSDGSGPFNHLGSVLNATNQPINITTVVPPILYFCAAITINEWCENVNGNFIDYSDLSPTIEDVGVSQFGAATNAIGGYVVTINGNTMTAGTRTIAALASPTANIPGTPQFGLNLRANTSPANGQDPVGVGIGLITPDYDTPDLFKFVNGDVVATAATGTFFNIFTATYIVNIPPDQPSGVYNTTIAYICTAAF